MRFGRYVLAATAVLALAACDSGKQDTLDTNEDNMQAEQLNTLADNAAAEAEMEALANQQQELQQAPAPTPPAPVDSNATDPSKVEDDVQGM